MGYCDEINSECVEKTTCRECLGLKCNYKKYSLTLDEIHFIFEEFLNNFAGDNSLENKRTVREIEDLRGWLTNAAIKGERLDRNYEDTDR